MLDWISSTPSVHLTFPKGSLEVLTSGTHRGPAGNFQGINDYKSTDEVIGYWLSVIGQQMKEEEHDQTYWIIFPFNFNSFLLKIQIF